MVTYPKDWSTFDFDQMFQLYPNNTLSRDKLSDHGNIGNIHYGDVLIKYGAVLTNKDDIPRIRPEYESDVKIKLQEKDVIIADTAEDETVGKVVQIGNVSLPLAGGLHTIICRPLIPTATGYLGYYMNSKEFHDQLLPYITGIKVSSISKTSIRKTELHLPSSEIEQAAIVNVISSFDTAIKNFSELIEKKKDIRDGALEDLVSGKTRLEGYKSEWVEHKLGDFLKIGRGASPRPIEAYITLNPDGVNWIKIGDAPRHGKYIVHTEEKITSAGASHSVEVRVGDFILSNSMSFGRPYILSVSGCIHDGWLKLYDYQTSADKEFLYYVLSSDKVREQYEAYAAGSGVQNLNKNVVKQVEVKLPSLEEQKAIAAVLSSMDVEIESLEDEREKMVQIREGAINDLLTGKVRLSV